MKNETPNRVRSIFLNAVENFPPEGWETYLDEACGDDQDLRNRVQALLEADQRPDSLLGSPTPTEHAEAAAMAALMGPFGDGAETIIGPYKVVEQIGEGGMGVVYRADQTGPVRRTVALKIIKPGMDTKQVIARFEAERQALALMDHPNIARVLDAGATEQGRPYFVMELVKGVPITTYCDTVYLTARERLELFLPVCKAIQHAHQKGIIHRDIKPSNVMITMVDGKPMPKVIDFGVAKAIDQRLTELTMFTHHGAVVGTFEYMSPEQAELCGLDIDTRSDIYALGVLLYELLTGSTPLEQARVRRAEYSEILRMIREEDPPKPSTRLSDSGERLALLAAQRRTEPTLLAKQVRGELDWIVMKCLDKDRTRRYETANGVARDLMRYLTNEPVEACPPTPRYRLKKLAWRHRAFLVTAALMLLSSIAGSTISIWQAIRATRAELQAEDAVALADQHRRLAERHLYAFSLRQASQAIEQEQIERAHEMLDSLFEDLGDPALGDFAWHYLNHIAFRQIAPIAKHMGGQLRLALSFDGQLLASGDDQGAIILTDVAAGQVLARLEGHSAPVKLLAFSPDRKLLASVAEDFEPEERHEVWIWDVTTGRRVAELDESRSGNVSQVFFSASSRRLVIAVQERPNDPITIQLFDLEPSPGHPVLLRSARVQSGFSVALGHGYLAAHPVGRSLTVFDMDTLEARWSTPARDHAQSWPVLSADGRRIGTEDGHSAVIWDTATGQELTRIEAGKPNCELAGLVLSRDGGKLLVHYRPLRLSVFDLGRGPSAVPRDLLLDQPEKYDLQQAEFSPDGSKVGVVTTGIKGGGQGPVSVFESSSGRPLAIYPRRPLILFAPGGESLIMTGDTTVLRWWFGRKTSDSPQSLGGHVDEAWAVTFSPDGRIVASGSDDTEPDDTLKLWDAASGRLIRSWRAHPGTVSALAFSPDGRTLASAALCPEQNVRLWDIATGRLKATLAGHTDRVRAVAYSPDGTRIASAGSDRTIRLWDATTGHTVAKLQGHTDTIRNVVISPDGRTLASASNDRSVRLWDIATGEVQREFRMLKKASAVAFSPDPGPPERLAATDEVGDVIIWELPSGELNTTIRGDLAPLMTLTFSSDGRTLATAGMSRVIKLWDVLSRQEILELKGHAAQINALAFSRDGRTLASCSHDGAVKLWRSEEQGTTQRNLRRAGMAASQSQ
jgi:WD40 repeat protein/serine/threonine protein kinase